MNIKTDRLYIDNNYISTIHPKAFWTSESNNTTIHTELKWLYLHNNKMKYIQSGTFDPLINVLLLTMYNNKISNIDNKLIVNVNKLSEFNIANNELTQLPTKWLPYNLQFLYIERNAIKCISINTFEGAFNLLMIALSVNSMTIEYNTFSNLTKLSNIQLYRNLDTCTCKYIWYLNTKSNNTVCDNSNNKYASIREYLKEECKERIAG